LVKALAGVLPDDGIAMQVTAAPFATSGKNAALAIVAALRHPIGNRQANYQVELIATAFTPDGQSRASVRQTARLTLRPDVNSDAQYEILSQIQLKPGRYSLRIAAQLPDSAGPVAISGPREGEPAPVRSQPAAGRTGSVFYDVTVPDFGKEALSLSGVLVSVTPDLPAAPKNALATITKVVPTSIRVFTSADTAVATLRVYQRGAKERLPVTVTARILDTADSSAFTATELVAADSFPADRSADYNFPIPLARLTPGAYLLTFEAVAGKHTARRDIRFTVR
jgi:hypothetical protein